MATTRTITGFAVNTIRTTDDGAIALVATITYSDATTDVVEWFVDRLVP